jgi:hypothetical protein
MMPTPTLEERVAALEMELAQIKRQNEPDKSQNSPRGWQRFVGVFKDDPDFEAGVRFGREWREAQRPLEAEDVS